MQRVVVTGANRGIGLGFVRAYLQRGDRVFACCRRPSEAAAIDELSQQHPDRCTVVALDVTSSAQTATAINQVSKHTDAVDVLINNAGVLFPSETLAEIQADHLIESVAVNAVAPLMLSRAFLPLLEAGVRPRVVNISATTRPLTDLTVTRNHGYVASRYAGNALTRMTAAEFADRGIVAVALWPGYLRTDMSGMDQAATPVDEAVPGVVDVIDRLDSASAGTFLMPDGTTHRW